MIFNLDFIPRTVRQLADWADFLLKTDYDPTTIKNGGGGVVVDSTSLVKVTGRGLTVGNFTFSRDQTSMGYLNVNYGLRFFSTGNLSYRGDTVIPSDGGALIALTNHIATQPIQILQAAPSQSAPIQKTKLVSSTSAVRDASTIDTIWTNSTDANRTSVIVFSTVDNAGALTERVRFDAGGIIVPDRTTGVPQRIYVDNGVLSVEAV